MSRFRFVVSSRGLSAMLLTAAVVLSTACGAPDEAAAPAAADSPKAPPPSGGRLPSGVEIPDFDLDLTVEEAYEAIPHRRTVFRFQDSSVPADEQPYLRAMFQVLEQGTRLRVVGYRDLYHQSTTDARPAERLKELLGVIDSIEPPEDLEEYHSLVRVALDEQQRVFEDWEIQREAFRHRRRIGGDPRIRGSSTSLHNAYDILMQRYGATESEHNKRALFDYHCAMDFL